MSASTPMTRSAPAIPYQPSGEGSRGGRAGRVPAYGADDHGAAFRRARRRKAQHSVTAVAMTIYQLLAGTCRALRAIPAETQVTERISFDPVLAPTHFTPGNGAVAVSIQANGVVQVAERNIPVAGGSLRIPVQGHIAVAWFMCVGG